MRLLKKMCNFKYKHFVLVLVKARPKTNNLTLHGQRGGQQPSLKCPIPVCVIESWKPINFLIFDSKNHEPAPQIKKKAYYLVGNLEFFSAPSTNRNIPKPNTSFRLSAFLIGPLIVLFANGSLVIVNALNLVVIALQQVLSSVHIVTLRDTKKCYPLLAELLLGIKKESRSGQTKDFKVQQQLPSCFYKLQNYVVLLFTYCLVIWEVGFPKKKQVDLFGWQRIGSRNS